MNNKYLNDKLSDFLRDREMRRPSYLRPLDQWIETSVSHKGGGYP